MTSGSLVAGGVEDVNITCTATVNYSVVDSADLVYSYTWRNSLGQLITDNNRIIIKSFHNNISIISLFPLSVMDTIFSCTAVVYASNITDMFPSDGVTQHAVIGHILGKYTSKLYLVTRFIKVLKADN